MARYGPSTIDEIVKHRYHYRKKIDFNKDFKLNSTKIARTLNGSPSLKIKGLRKKSIVRKTKRNCIKKKNQNMSLHILAYYMPC